jgi:colanic acid/amylovoran biosynthesis glycosyltransferase
MTVVEHERIGYVVKRYPRYSETFVVNEILAHEAAGAELEIFSLLPSNDTHFQDTISRVRAPVTTLTPASPSTGDLRSALEAADDASIDVAHVLRIARGEAVRDVYAALLLAVAARRRRIGHLHAHFATSAAAVARLASLFVSIPYTLTAHAKDIFHDSVETADLVRKFADARAVVTVSDHNVDHLNRTVASATGKVIRIYNGIDVGRFPFASSGDRAPLILGVGRLVEKKGFGDLVAACGELARRGRTFTCDIVGTGPLEGDLRAEIDRIGLGARIALVGPRPQHEVFARMERASVFAAPCTVGEDGNRDGLPTVLLEAMALGTPCVATPVTGIPEAIAHDETGILVPERDPIALADALERLLDDGDLRVRLATNARRTIERDFDVTRNAARLRTLFGSLPTVDALAEVA